MEVHALPRGAASASVNWWPGRRYSLTKRPGSAAGITANGVTGLGGTCTALNTTVFNGVQYLIVQNGTKLAYASSIATSWISLSPNMGSGANRIHSAQIYDPLQGTVCVFICNGQNFPYYWELQLGSALAQTSVAAGLPVNQGGTLGITPRFVTILNGSLVYAGEPTNTSAVFISNPWYPESFTQSASGSTNYPGSYQPYLVGYDDGIAGGDITGLAVLQGSLIVFKQFAIYRGTFTNIYGTTYGFAWSLVSAQRGCVAPESIVEFDTYICFLSGDGVYYTDGYSVTQISQNVPTFFDAGINGYAPLCQSYFSAVAVRSGTRYVLFYDRGTPGSFTPATYPTSGLWFDFSTTDEDGLPIVGELQGVTSAAGTTWAVSGMVSVGGGFGGNGTIFWTDPTQDRVGQFGEVFSDFSSPIAVTYAGPADPMPEISVPSPDARGISSKTVHRVFVETAPVAQITCSLSLITDQQVVTTLSATSPAVTAGSGIPGAFPVPSAPTSYEPVSYAVPSAVDGKTIQVAVQESSTTEWTLLGVTVEASARMPNL